MLQYVSLIYYIVPNLMIIFAKGNFATPSNNSIQKSFNANPFDRKFTES